MIWKRMNNTEAKKIVEGIEKNSEEGRSRRRISRN